MQNWRALYASVQVNTDSMGKSNTGEESSNQGSPEPVRRKEEQEIQGVSSKKAIGALVNLEQEVAEGEVVSALIFFDNHLLLT